MTLMVLTILTCMSLACFMIGVSMLERTERIRQIVAARNLAEDGVSVTLRNLQQDVTGAVYGEDGLYGKYTAVTVASVSKDVVIVQSVGTTNAGARSSVMATVDTAQHRITAWQESP